MSLKKLVASAALLGAPVLAQSEPGVPDFGSAGTDVWDKDIASCPGYIATNAEETESGFYADLSLAGEACNAYGIDLPELRLEVEYQTDARLHVKITDANNTVYQVPDEVFHRPGFGQWATPADSLLQFDYQADPFEFTVSRKDSGEVLFDTSGSKLVFESQYVYLKTNLPTDPHLYGLGEHSDNFMLNTTDYVRTIYTRDAYGTPLGENLYSAHPVYFDHRQGSGTHGVFLLNSNGMDVYINNEDGKQYLEYNIIGGVLDFYFVAGPSPREVAVQYSEITQLPLMVPYWGLGYHQCKYGYRDIYEVAAVVANYSEANIPLETMWTDIDYMDRRRVFTNDPDRYPLDLWKDFVDTLHERDQHYIVMVDPAVYYSDPNPAHDAGVEQDVFIKDADGSFYQGVVWPGPSYFPDWFHPNTQAYWTEQFAQFFDGVNGPDIDALWIDMNEPANFYNRPYGLDLTPEEYSDRENIPPTPPPIREGPDAPIPGFPASLQPNWPTESPKYRRRRHQPTEPKIQRRAGANGGGNWRAQQGQTWGQGEPGPLGNEWQSGKATGSGCATDECKGLPGRELISPPYMIQNGAGPTLAESTADTDLLQAQDYVQYDTHSLYGAMMSSTSYQAMRARRPDERALIITRSTFAGSGKDVSHWLGDNLSGWVWLRLSISQILQFASLYQIPVVGPDICGFGDDTTETLCARWATLGSFYTFMRNHANIDSIYQEFYRWSTVAEAARNGLSIRYQLLDYIYTSIYRQNQTGLPALNPLFFNYPEDQNTYPIDLQFFYGDGILVSPVTGEGETVNYYLPDDIFYEWGTGLPVRGEGAYVTADVPLTDITVHYKGGVIFPQRVEGANTTTLLRTKGFNVVIAPGLDGTASGSLYLDDGHSYTQQAVSEIDFAYADGTLTISGSFEYDAGVGIELITLLGVEEEPELGEDAEYDAENKKLVLSVDVPLTGETDVTIL
jgi:alpha-glucosidase